MRAPNMQKWKNIQQPLSFWDANRISWSGVTEFHKPEWIKLNPTRNLSIYSTLTESTGIHSETESLKEVYIL